MRTAAKQQRRPAVSHAMLTPGHEQDLIQGCLDMAGVLTVALDRAGRVALINQAGRELLGYAQGEMLGRDWFAHFLPERVRASTREVFGALLAGDEASTEHVENPVLTKGGDERLILWYNTALRDERGHVVGTLGSGTDITERARVERALRESERRFRSLFEASPDAVFVEDLEGNVLDVNPAACRLHRAACDDLIGQNVSALVPPAQRATALRDFERLVKGRVRRLRSYSWTVNRHTVPVEIRASRFAYGGQDAALLIVRDVSEQRALEQKVLRISEEERQRIGQDIHDGLASHFSGIAMLSRGLARRLQQGQPIPPGHLEEIAELAGEGAAQARALARGLNPVDLSGEGLQAALKELAHSAEVLGGLDYTLDMDEALPPLESTAATQLYRIAQEAVTNALKHAGAMCLALRLRARDGRLVLTVRDDGRGLPQDHAEAEGMGLHIMPYRARAIGATLRINSAPGAGTTVTCAVPLAAVRRTHPS